MMEEHWTSDPAALVWLAANLMTGIAYLHIPVEIWYMVRKTRLDAFNFIALSLAAFVLSCGMHHLVMLGAVGHHPLGTLQVSVDVAMAVASCWFSYLILRLRPGIAHAVERILARAREARETRDA